MSSTPAYFTRSDDVFVPTPFSLSLWARATLSGPPVCGLMAREVEARYRTDEFVPARLTVDLHRAVPAVPLTVHSEVIRDGKRVRAVAIELHADDAVVARGSALLLKRSTQPPGEVWRPDRDRPLPPPSALATIDETLHLFGSDGHAEGWSPKMTEHQNDTRKRKWVRNIPVVDGEPASPFCYAAMTGEQTSLVTNWGTEGIGFINTDVSITFSRMPIGTDMGVEAESHLSDDGIAAGAAVLYDTEGAFGICTTTALANAHRQISGTVIDTLTDVVAELAVTPDRGR
ncbi:acyl-CoA thioesterase domain-containing protein [Nocardia mangyaensis]|uniref:acyl-CoA thioesterase domain-containing protein n=1 Tax=Nocardia mangyaensis TaxID=2213200 RepID=UPI002675BEAD|nr:acyl-CoA thioesterase domain-containing protein [Nocardia mangyaensis]MDO3649475.1 thioesterase family protein [Nocardia mangyaensis]